MPVAVHTAPHQPPSQLTPRAAQLSSHCSPAAPPALPVRGSSYLAMMTSSLSAFNGALTPTKLALTLQRVTPSLDQGKLESTASAVRTSHRVVCGWSEHIVGTSGIPMFVLHFCRCIVHSTGFIDGSTVPIDKYSASSLRCGSANTSALCCCMLV
jgi:hypothetical protein